MKKTVTLTHPAPPHHIAAMLGSESFMRLRLSQAPVSNIEITRAEETLTTRVTVSQVVFPRQAKMFFSGSQDPQITIAESIRSSDLDSDRSFIGNSSISSDTLPFSVIFDQKLVPSSQSADTTIRTIEVTLTVNIPLFARKVEEAAMSQLDTILALEEQVAATWLSQNPQT